MAENPSTPQEWLRASKTHELDGSSTMVSLAAYKSASKLPEAQFLLLRALWQRTVKPAAFAQLQTRYISPNLLTQAQEHLDRNQTWQQYLANLPRRGERRQVATQSIGQFSGSRWRQLAIQAFNPKQEQETSCITPSKALLSRLSPADRAAARLDFTNPRLPRAARPRTFNTGSSTSSSDSGETSASDYSQSNALGGGIADDEEIVNIALISLLDDIMLIAPRHHLETTAERKRFQFGDLWTATTDGYVRSLYDQKAISAIIEVKAAQRIDIARSVQRQEAAEMAAWICSDDGLRDTTGNAWRLLVAQDYNELWLVFAEFSDCYVQYLRQSKQQTTLGDDTFMRLIEVGPFKLENAHDMHQFGTFLTAFCLQISQATPPRAPARPRNPSAERGARKGGPQAGPSLSSQNMQVTSLEARMRGVQLGPQSNSSSSSQDGSNRSSDESPSKQANRRRHWWHPQ